MKRRRVSDEYMASWFSYEPVSRPAPKPPGRARVPRGSQPAKAVRRR